MPINKPDFSFVVSTVLNMYEENNFNKIDVFEMVNKIGIKLIPYSALSIRQQQACLESSSDGFSVERNGHWIIYYNDEINNFGRIKFTIMHEIGHFHLGHQDDGEIEEQEANFFAKYALAPPSLIHQLPEINVYTIQQTFEISLEAAFYAHIYYLKWLEFGGKEYTKQERKLLKQFGITIY